MIGDVMPESPGEIFKAELLDVDSKLNYSTPMTGCIMPESLTRTFKPEDISRSIRFNPSAKVMDTVNSLKSPGGAISANAGFAVRSDSVRSTLYVKKLLRVCHGFLA